MDGSERRRFLRVQRPFTIRYRDATEAEKPWRITTLRDLSLSGARFVADQAFDVGRALELQVVAPVSLQPIFLKAHVVWVRSKNPILRLYEYGVAFDVIDAAVQRLIDFARPPPPSDDLR